MTNPAPDQHEHKPSTTDQTPNTSPKGGLGKSIGLGIVGAVAAVIVTFAMRQTGEVFRLSDDLLKLTTGAIPNSDEQKLIGAGLVVLNYKHYALWIGIAGAIIGVLFGLTLGVMRRSRSSIIAGVLGGLIFGGVFSACGGFAANYVGENIVHTVRLTKLQVPEQYSMLLHATTWAIVGLGVGLGTGLGGTQNRMGSAIGSMIIAGIAGAAGGALFPFLYSVLMPLVDTSITIPKTDFDRLVWIGIPCVLMGLVLGRKG